MITVHSMIFLAAPRTTQVPVIPATPGKYSDLLYRPYVYSYNYLWFCLLFIAFIIAIIALIFLYTQPYQTLKKHRLTRGIALRNLKRGTLRRIDKIEQDLQRGDISLHPAHEALDKTIRKFLLIETDLPVLSMHKAAIHDSALSPYLASISVTDTGRYSIDSDPLIMHHSQMLKNLVQGWKA